MFQAQGPNGEFDGVGNELRHMVGPGSQGGAVAGGLLGAQLGTMLGPIGTVLGGMAGAGIGAVAPNLIQGTEVTFPWED